ncbi:hypothetical protein N656DRAFT_792657 [Canariomyces notabilis]|uniref:Uncharacterized protein n=1 Tax=Canariomyces notabilis TaxID=2074819 RepID=A0AAN6QDR2_9PEZI|nr:hypothetical protein N656DRAFT_792657 [Canariomyces arenarius]
MVTKRKRSDSEISFASSAFSSPSRTDGNSFNFNAMSAMDTARRGFFSPRLSTPSHLPSRTMKRFRDNRPSETEVYQHTLGLLYSAQQHQQQPPHTPPRAVNNTASSFIQPHTHAASQHNGARSQQRSLHSFWNLPRPPATSSAASSPASSVTSLAGGRSTSVSTRCEDCDARLDGGNLDDEGDFVAMDIDGYGLGTADVDIYGHVCGACGKSVCGSCSVSNLGEHRRCLACAGR